ncbi:MAG: sigma-70 family RNA polymerase sigma factor [bacterium]
MNLVSSRETKFEDVYERNASTVYRVCFMYVKNKHDAEDLTQNTFIKYMKYDPSFESLSHEKSWFIVVASNTCKNHFKAWWNKNTMSLAEEYIGSSEDNNDILEIVLKLPNRYKKIVYLFYYEGYTTKEISTILGINESTIRTQLSKARSLLKSKIGELK